MSENPTPYQCAGRFYTPEEIVLLSCEVAKEKKAERPVVLDLRNLNVFSEYFVILSGTNVRQVYAIADGIKVFFKSFFGLFPVSVDGLETSTWILIDYGFFFVHVFEDKTREKYQLEGLWNKGRLVDLDSQKYLSLFHDIYRNSEKKESVEIEF